MLRIFEEFNNAGCLLISEVKYLLENRDKDAPDTAYEITNCYARSNAKNDIAFTTKRLNT